MSFVRTVEAQFLDINDFVVSKYGMDEGLPQSSVNDIIQTRDGYIWLATYGGLVRFDGSTFTTFNRSNTKGMISDRLIKLHEDPVEGIWVFMETSSQVFLRCKQYSCQSYSFPEMSASINEMYTDKQGRLWLSAFGNVYIFENDEFKETHVSLDPDLIGQAVKEDDGVWMIQGSRLLRTLGERVVQVENLSHRKEAGYINVLEYPEGSDSLFIGTNADGVFLLHEDTFQPFNNSNGSVSNAYIRFKQFRQDLFFSLYVSGLGIWDGEGFKELVTIPWTTPLQFKTILVDNEGNFWIGTNANGLFKLHSSSITMIDSEDGLTVGSMLSLAPRSDGTALLSSNCGGIFEWDGKQATPSKIQEYFLSGCNWAVFEDSRGRIWVGSNSLYMTTSPEVKGITFGTEQGFPPTHVRGIMEDSEQNIWIATSNGAFRYDDHNFHHYSKESYGLADNTIQFIMEDRDGLIWLGTGSGVNILKEDAISPVDMNLDDIRNYIPPQVRSIYEDEDGYVWVGTYGDGLFRFKEGDIKKVTEQDGLFDNIISHIIEDEFGNFWMGSNRGISSVSRKQLNDYMDGVSDSFTAYSYGTSDGMNSAETNGAFQPNSFMDGDGNIYFPTVEGVAVVSTRDISRNRIPPLVYLESVRSADSVFSSLNDIVVPHDTPYLEFNYTAVNFSDPDKSQFRYKMEGLDVDWIDVGKRRTAVYSRIPPGNYTFRVISSNESGIWNEEGASLSVNIIPPFWQTWWFSVISVLGLFGVILSAFYLRYDKLRKESERQKRFTEQLIESQEKERNRIANELHDGLGQQLMVIKNRAEFARSKMSRNDELNDHLTEILNSTVSSISDVRTISHGLRPVHLEKFGLTEAIRDLCVQLQESSEIEWSYHIDEVGDVVPREKEINFYRVIQEGVNNILKHSSADEASIIVNKTETGVTAKVWDNGKGFDMKMREDLSGIGFVGMQERIDNLSGTLEIISGNKKGTSLNIHIPVRSYDSI